MKLGKRDLAKRDKMLDEFFRPINSTNAPLLREAFLEHATQQGWQIVRLEDK